MTIALPIQYHLKHDRFSTSFSFYTKVYIVFHIEVVYIIHIQIAKFLFRIVICLKM